MSDGWGCSSVVEQTLVTRWFKPIHPRMPRRWCGYFTGVSRKGESSFAAPLTRGSSIWNWRGALPAPRVFRELTRLAQRKEIGVIEKRVKVPTGDILVVHGDRGSLECLSLGDYGKEKNIKADFMGLSREIDGVDHQGMLPLEEKWVITISSQYGCSMGCSFCDVPKAGPGINASFEDMRIQIIEARLLHPEVVGTKRLNIHFARMGEPTFNREVLMAGLLAKDMFGKRFHVHPVISTMMPRRNRDLRKFLSYWMEIKNKSYDGEAGLQLSINTTNEADRMEMFRGNALMLEEISELMNTVVSVVRGRKIALNFAITDRTKVDGKLLARLFDPEKYMCKITPMHDTRACRENGINTPDGYRYYYPYRKVEEELKRFGFDVLVFIPSIEEDQSRITCGNAVLSDERGKG